MVCGLLLVALLSVPRIGGAESMWLNGLYECFCLIVMFPLIVWLGAGGKIEGQKASKICKFLGDISYPIYITHYPLVYVYMGWVANNGYTLEESWIEGSLVAVAAIGVAYLSMRLYDIPVREWLRKRFL